jgi:predicted unusual protein kinase regulating ubiquinone biosynthesis (AarF/ABC1/UbiB family)
VHADLHPGNIFITADSKLTLLDLGLVGELDPPHRRSFARFFAAWAQRDGDTMARLLYAMSSADPRDERAFERFRSSMIEFVGRYWGQRLARCRWAWCCSTCWRSCAATASG